MNVAIITARGGSKRIPRKNIKDFCGKPIMAYSIEAAIKSELFAEVMVSTDDEEIASIAKKYGANVPFMRSKATSDDYATTSDVLKEVLEEYKKRGRVFTWMSCIYPTAPFVTAETLKDAYKLLIDKQGDMLEPVVRFSYPPQRAVVMNEEGFLKFKHPEHFRTRSQDLEPLYHDAGQFYFYRAEGFEEGLRGRVVPYILDDLHVQDIDNLEDWKLAEIKYNLIFKEQFGGEA